MYTNQPAGYTTQELRQLQDIQQEAAKSMAPNEIDRDKEWVVWYLCGTNGDTTDALYVTAPTKEAAKSKARKELYDHEEIRDVVEA